MSGPTSSTFTYGGSHQLTLDGQLDRALTLMEGDPEKAARLFMAWADRDTEIAGLLPDLLTGYIRQRIEARQAFGPLVDEGLGTDPARR